MHIQGEIKRITHEYFHHINNDLLGTFIDEQLSNPPLNPSDRNLQVSLVNLLASQYAQSIEHYNYNKYDFHEVYNFIHHELDKWIPLFQSKKLSISNNIAFNNFIKTQKHKVRQMIFHLSTLEQHWIKFKNIEHPLIQPLFSTFQNFFDQFSFTHYHLTIQKTELENKWIKKLLYTQFDKIDITIFRAFYNALILWEYYITLAKTIVRKSFHFATFHNSNQLSVKGLYHPLIPNAVKNDITIQGRVVLLTGANMSGKSAFLKSIYLLYYFSLRGFPIWSSETTLPLMNDASIIHVKDDDIASGESHFVKELQQLKSLILHNEQAPMIGFMDELFNTTNAEDAKVIITQTIKGLLLKQQGIFFISSHIAALQDEFNQDEDLQVYYLDSRVENQEPIFTYELKTGWNNINLGQQLYAQSGIPNLLNNNHT